MIATVPGSPVVASPLRALFEPPGQSGVFQGGHDPAYMVLQLQRLQRPAR
jgi:hypothetical protein